VYAETGLAPGGPAAEVGGRTLGAPVRHMLPDSDEQDSERLVVH
jgi:hypothetical protein